MTDIMQKKFKIFKYSLRKYTNASFSRIYNQFHLILYSLVHEWIITNGFLLNIIWLLVFQIHWNLQNKIKPVSFIALRIKIEILIKDLH